MRITLHRLRGANVLSYGEFDFILDEAKVYQLIGKNGSGKSSLPSILEEVLYNNNSRGIKKTDLPNRNIEGKDWWGEVTFFVEDDKYVVHKQVKSSAKVTLTKNYEDISGHTATQTYNKIKEIFGGTDFKTFTKLVYQSMVSSMDFLTATDANRKKFLISLLGLDKYSEKETLLKNARKEAKTAFDKLEGKLETVQSWVRKNSTIKSPESEIEIPELDDKLVESINELRAKLKTLQIENESIDSHNQEVDRQKSEYRKYNQRLERLKQLEEDLPAPAQDLSDEIQSITRDLTDVQSRMAVFKKEYQKFKEESSHSECPTCGTELDVSAQEKARDIAKNNFLELKPERDKLQHELDELKDKHKSYDVFKKAKDAYDRQKSIVDELGEVTEPTLEYKHKSDDISIKKEMQSLEKLVNEQRQSIKNAEDHNANVRVENAKIEHIKNQYTEYAAQLDNLQSQLQDVETKVNNLDVLCKAFGPKGLISYKIESNIKVFEDLINKYLSKFTFGLFALGFELDSTKLKVVVYNNGDEVTMNSLSSGEQSKVNVATLLAIRNLMSSISDLDINLLFLDEIISVLDNESRDVLVDILLEEENLNTFLVSHGYDHPLTTDIRLKKVNGISRVTNG